ncbi:MAG: carotenoid oxygenase [Rhizobacter sp.]|nr:carotenoid oxygenase [Rhizobacter sp.]
MMNADDVSTAALRPPPVEGSNNVDPIPMECDAPFLRVEGELPPGLNGTLYRNGPNPQFAKPGAHWFSGDGMLHAFTLDNGRASYRNRWTRTAHWQAEHDAGHPLFDAYGRDATGSKSNIAADEGVANTNIVWHAGRLLALEEAHLPFEVDPRTLERRGPHNFAGAISGPFTAHPKTDPLTGELVFFGYGATGPLSAGMTHGSVDAAGKVTRFQRFDAPYAAMVHDFMVTSGHVLFPILPLTASMPRVERGGPPFAWEPEMGARVGVMKRGGSVAELRWFEGDSGYVFHVLNAWEDGERIMADVMRYEEPPLFPHPDGRPTDPAKSGARLCRWTFDLASASNRFTQQDLDDLVGEFPRIDDRRAGLEHRHGWFICDRAGADERGYGGLVHLDAQTGRRTIHWLTPGDEFSEPVFVPRHAKADEGDGWLLATVWRAALNRSELAVFNATSVDAGPIATVPLAHRVPAGFHGNWLPAEALR